MTSSPHRGFVALLSAIIISVILLALAVSLSQGTFFARFDGLYTEYKRISRTLAEACVYAALGKIGNDYEYAVDEDPTYDALRDGVIVDLGTLYGTTTDCVIAPFEQSDDIDERTLTIRTHATFYSAFSNLIVTATAHNPRQSPTEMPPSPTVVITNWREAP